MTHGTIRIPARDFEDDDDCLVAAESMLLQRHPKVLRNYAMSARWLDDERDVILVDVPARLLGTLHADFDIHTDD